MVETVNIGLIFLLLHISLYVMWNYSIRPAFHKCFLISCLMPNFWLWQVLTKRPVGNRTKIIICITTQFCVLGANLENIVHQIFKAIWTKLKHFSFVFLCKCLTLASCLLLLICCLWANTWSQYQASWSIVLVCTLLFSLTLSFSSLPSMRRDRTTIL